VSAAVILQATPLIEIRERLEEVFQSLDLIHDEISVTSEAARSEGQPEIANVLTFCVCNKMFDQLKLLTGVIEKLGGRTNLSEGQDERSGGNPSARKVQLEACHAVTA